MRVMRAILWVLGSFLASKIVGNFVFEVFNEPGAGVNLVTAFIPALFSAVIFSFGIYKAFFDKQKTNHSKEKNPNSSGNYSTKIDKAKVTLTEDARFTSAHSFQSNNLEIGDKSNVQINDDVLWERALIEFDEGSAKKGLWAKCFSEANGDEAVAKANYLKIRVNQLSNTEISHSSSKSSTSSDYSSMSIKNLLEQNLYIKKMYNNKELLYFKNDNVGCVVGSVIRVFENENFCKKAIESGNIGQRAKGLIVSISKDTFEIC